MSKLDEILNNILGDTSGEEDDQQEVQIPFGNTPCHIPNAEDLFTPKEYHVIKDSRFGSIYDYCDTIFEELNLIEGVYIAGGCFRSLIDMVDEVADIDVFFKNEEALMKAFDVMNKYSGSEEGCWYEAFRCPRNELITYKTAIETFGEDPTPEQRASQRKIQFITKSFYYDVEQLLNSFDFTPTCACYNNNILYTHPDWARHVLNKELWLHDISYPVATLNRMVKYKEKGYKLIPLMLVDVVQKISDRDFDEGMLQLYVD